MDANFLVGAATVAAMSVGIWGLVFRKNGKPRASVPSETVRDPWPVDKLAEAIEPLADLPVRLEQVFRQELQSLRDVQTREPEIPPDWLARVLGDLEHINDRLSEPGAIPPELAAGLERIADRLEMLLELAAPAQPQVLDALADRLEAIAQSVSRPAAPEPAAELWRSLVELPERISREIGELFAAERGRPAKSAAPPANLQAAEGGGTKGGGAAGGSSSHPPPARRAPPPFARWLPVAPPATPSIPAPYVPGSVWVPAGEVWSLLALIQQQLSLNCPGTAVEFRIEADPANSDPILVGGASSIGGPLSVENYAYQLLAGSEARTYRSSYPGSNTPVGELQVLAPEGGWLHVEVQS